MSDISGRRYGGASRGQLVSLVNASARQGGIVVKSKLDRVANILSDVSGEMRRVVTVTTRTDLPTAIRLHSKAALNTKRVASRYRVVKSRVAVQRLQTLSHSLDREAILIHETVHALRLATTVEQSLPLIKVLEESAKRVTTMWDKIKFSTKALLALAIIGLTAYAISSAPEIFKHMIELSKELDTLAATVGSTAIQVGAAMACTLTVTGLIATGIGIPAGIAVGTACAGLLWKSPSPRVGPHLPSPKRIHKNWLQYAKD